MQQIAPVGEPSLQNSIELALKSLRLLPSHASKEILIIVGALTTCDPGDINETIQVCIVNCKMYYVTQIILKCYMIILVIEHEDRICQVQCDRFGC